MPSADPSTQPADRLLLDGPAAARCLLLLAHGAGQGPDSPFMTRIASGLGDAGVRVVRFAFPYWARSETEGRKRPPDREPVLRQRFLELIEAHRGQVERLAIGGKSMGGRIASLIADEAGVDRLLCLGFPFHAPGRPERFRGDHLAELSTPTLLCQGERDPFGTRAEVSSYALSPACRVEWIDDGEHSFKPRKASGRSWEQNLDLAVGHAAAFLTD